MKQAETCLTEDNGVTFTAGLECPRLDLFFYSVFVAYPLLTEPLTLLLH